MLFRVSPDRIDVVIKTKFILPKKHTQSNLVKPFNDYKYTTYIRACYRDCFLVILKVICHITTEAALCLSGVKLSSTTANPSGSGDMPGIGAGPAERHKPFPACLPG
jgi:hypothetical protein